MYYPDKDEFLKLSKKGNLIPVTCEILGDLDTPVSAYFKIAQKAKYSFLLESVEGEAKVARYSFLAKDPEIVIQSKDDHITITKLTGKKSQVTKLHLSQNPLAHIRDLLRQYKFVNIKNLPCFCGGLVGFLSYDIVRFFEELPAKTTDDLKLPDMLLVLAKEMVIFDHLNHTIKIVHCAEIDQKAPKTSKIQAFNKATKSIDHLIKQLQEPLTLKQRQNKQKLNKEKKIKFKSNVTQKKFEENVRKAQKHIRAGDIIQVVLSQRLSVDLTTNPFNIYRSLRSLNPSPYMYYLDFNGVQIIGASPELLVRCEDGMVDTRPIAGTRPRGKTDAEDAALAEELLNDPKEKAEHIMLVDLGRNDIGRVSKKGSVKLSEFMAIEKYSHVMHIISNVRGKLASKMDDLDVLEAAFPAGTVSGAPKIRAMEIIEDLEKHRRGPYAGCIGYFSFSGNLDSCITIRTIVVKNKKAYIQAGAGIVADSVPASEYKETLNKAKAAVAAIKLAEKLD